MQLEFLVALLALLSSIVTFAVIRRRRGRSRESASIRVGSRLGPYSVRSLLGKGGMGEVYGAYDSRLDRDVAIKIVLRSVASERDRVARFEREAKALAALSHPNILTIHDIGTEGGVTYLVTELVKGAALRRTLRAGALAPDRVVRLGVQIAEGLAAAHERGIIHRDLKPENLILTDDDQVKILDFGLAKLMWADAEAETQGPENAEGERPTPSRLTKPAALVGTVGYISPEQIQDSGVDHRADIFALGVILTEMLTGRRPFDTLVSVLQPEEPRLSDVNPEIPPGLADVVCRSLRREPGERFQTAGAVVAALRALGSESRSTAPAVPGPDPPESSTAVLPFRDMSPGRDHEYLCEGIAEEILNALTRSGGLRVVARSSAFRYKDRPIDLRQIGRELGVRTVLEGSVRMSGNRLRLTATLVNTEDGYQLWSESHDRDLVDVFAIQDEIALRIVESLKPQLVGKQAGLVADRHPDLAAYQLYLKARFQLNTRSATGLRQALSYSERAIAADEGYAPAYACLADSLILLSFQGSVAPAEVMPRAISAARQAIEMDQSLAEPYASLGFALAAYERDWRASGRAFRSALDLNPGYATAHYWYGLWKCLPNGEFARAEAEIQKARELDPLSLVVNAGLAWQLYFAGEFQRALEEVNRVLEIDETFVMARDIAAQAHGQLGGHDHAISHAQKAVSLSKGRTLSLGTLGYAYAASGDRALAEETLQALLDIEKSRYVSPCDIALVYTGLGDAGRALTFLEKACDERNGWIVFLRVEPRFARLRSDQRYSTLLERVGLTAS